MRFMMKSTLHTKHVSVHRITRLSNNLAPLALRMQELESNETNIHVRATFAYDTAYETAIAKGYTLHQSALPLYFNSQPTKKLKPLDTQDSVYGEAQRERTVDWRTGYLYARGRGRV